MHLSPRRHSTVGDVLRVLAGWLVLVLLLQGAAAAHALGAGPLHRHVASAHAPAHASEQHHQAAERHQHIADADAATAVPAAEQALDTASFALTAALALLAWGCGALRQASIASGHVLRRAAGWTLRSAWQLRLRRPPRHC